MTTDVELAITGMTCASCANRIERKLNKLDGVTATVNYATEKAKVSYPGTVSTDDLLRTVEAAGYAAALPSTEVVDDAPERDPLLQRLLVSAALSIPVVALGMVTAWQFTYWQWASLVLAAPVVVWGALPFHRAAWTNLRHGATTMDTLVSVGVLAAFGWSLWALFLGTAGEPGMTHPFRISIDRTDGAGNIYLEAAAGVTTFLLAGRWLEHRSKRQSGAALRALLELGVRDVGVLRDGSGGQSEPRPDRPAGRRGRVRRTPRGEDRDRRRGRRGLVRRRRLDAHRRVGAGRGASRRRRGRRHRQRRRTPRRPRDPRRRRHPARPDGAPRRGRAERQGRGAAPRRPGLRRLRAGRDRARRRDPRLLARRRRWRDRGLHRRRLGADHRLPLRPGPGHADRTHGRHRSRRPARHPDQGSRGARADPPRRHDRARQDRHRHHRRDDRPRGGGRRRRERGRRTPSRRRPRVRVRAPDRPGHRRPSTVPLPDGRGLRQRRGPRGAGHRRRPRRARRPAAAARGLVAAPRRGPGRRRRARAGRGTYARRGRLGRPRPRRHRRRRHGEADVRRGDRAAARPRPHPDPAHRRQRRRRARTSPTRSASRR